MNQKLEKIRDELALYHPHERTFKDGFNAAEKHIRQDEREMILNVLNECEPITLYDRDRGHKVTRFIESKLKEE